MKTDREIKLCELWKAGEPLQQTFCTTLQRLQKSTDSLVLKREFVQIKQRCTDSVSSTYRLGINMSFEAMCEGVCQ